MNQLALIRATAACFAQDLRARFREVLFAAAPAIALATVVHVLSPLLFRAIVERGRSMAVLEGQIVCVEALSNFLVLLAAAFAIAAYLRIATDHAGARRAYEAVAPISSSLLLLTLLLGVVWVAGFALQYWLLTSSAAMRAFLKTGAGRGTSQILTFVLISLFVALVVSVPALAEHDEARTAASALASALRLLPRTLFPCALLVFVFDVAVNAILQIVYRSAAGIAGVPSSRAALLSLLTFIVSQIFRYIGLYALVCLFLEVKQKPEQNAPAS